MLDFLHNIIFLLLILGWNVTGFLEIYLQIVFFLFDLFKLILGEENY